MPEDYRIQDVASRSVKLGGRLLWRLRLLSSFLDLISAGFFLFGWLLLVWFGDFFCLFICFLVKACQIHSLILLEHPCLLLTFLLLLYLQWQKRFALGAADMNH